MRLILLKLACLGQGCSRVYHFFVTLNVIPLGVVLVLILIGFYKIDSCIELYVVFIFSLNFICELLGYEYYLNNIIQIKYRYSLITTIRTYDGDKIC